MRENEKMNNIENNQQIHVGIILDGNRRYAEKKGLSKLQGHKEGYEKIKKVLEWAKDINLGELTLYCFSVQNFNRNKEEVDYLMDMLNKASEEIKNPKFMNQVKENEVKIRLIGRKEMLPKIAIKNIKAIEETTKDFNKHQLNFAIAYGGREEIIDSVKKIAEKVKKGELNPEEINESTISENNYLKSEPNIIIRTGGTIRTSNFLTWQSNYSEWLFLEKTWPEFEKEDLIKAIERYHQTDRRFGK